MQKGTLASPSTGLRNKTSKKRKRVEPKVARCVKSETMTVLAREPKMGFGVCNAGDVCNNEAAVTFTDLDANLRPFAAVGDCKVRVDCDSSNVVLAPSAVPVIGTDLIENLASDPLSSDSEGENDYPTDYWLETFPKILLQGIPENSLQEDEIEMTPNRFYFIIYSEDTKHQ